MIEDEEEINIETNNKTVSKFDDFRATPTNLTKILLAKKRKRIEQSSSNMLENLSISSSTIHVRQYRLNDRFGISFKVSKKSALPQEKFNTPFVLLHNLPLIQNGVSGTLSSITLLKSGIMFYPWFDSAIKIQTSPSFNYTLFNRWNYDYTNEEAMTTSKNVLEFKMGFTIETIKDSFGYKYVLTTRTNFSTESCMRIEEKFKYISVLSLNTFDTSINEIDYNVIDRVETTLYETQKLKPVVYYRSNSDASYYMPGQKTGKLHSSEPPVSVSIQGETIDFLLCHLVMYIPNTNVSLNEQRGYINGNEIIPVNIPKIISTTNTSSPTNFCFFVSDKPYITSLKEGKSTETSFLLHNSFIPENVIIPSNGTGNTDCYIMGGSVYICGVKWDHPVFIFKINISPLSFTQEPIDLNYTVGNGQKIRVSNFANVGDIGTYFTSVASSNTFNSACDSTVVPSSKTIPMEIDRNSTFRFNMRYAKVTNPTATLLSHFTDNSPITDPIDLRFVSRTHFCITITKTNITNFQNLRTYSSFFNNASEIIINNGSTTEFDLLTKTNYIATAEGLHITLFFIPVGIDMEAYISILRLNNNQKATVKIGKVPDYILGSFNLALFTIKPELNGNGGCDILLWCSLLNYAIKIPGVFAVLNPITTGISGTNYAFYNESALTGIASNVNTITYNECASFSSIDGLIGGSRFRFISLSNDTFTLLNILEEKIKVDISNYFISTSSPYRYYPNSLSKTDITSSGTVIGHNWNEWSGFRREHFNYNISRPNECLCVFVPDYAHSTPIRFPWPLIDSLGRRESYMVLIPKMSDSTGYSYVDRVFDFSAARINGVAQSSNSITDKIELLCNIGCIVIKIFPSPFQDPVNNTDYNVTLGNETDLRNKLSYCEIYSQTSGATESSTLFIDSHGIQLILTPDGILCDATNMNPLVVVKPLTIYGTLIVARSSFILPKHNPEVEVNLNRFPVGRYLGLTCESNASASGTFSFGSSYFPNRNTTTKTFPFGIFGGYQISGQIQSPTTSQTIYLSPAEASCTGLSNLFYDVMFVWDTANASLNNLMEEFIRKNIVILNMNYGSTTSVAPSPFTDANGMLRLGTETNLYTTSSASSPISAPLFTGSMAFGNIPSRVPTALQPLPFGEFNGGNDSNTLTNTSSFFGLANQIGVYFSSQFLLFYGSRLRAFVKPVAASNIANQSLIDGRFNLDGTGATDTIPIIGETISNFTDEISGSPYHIANGICSTTKAKIVSFQVTRIGQGLNAPLYSQFVVPTSTPIIMNGMNSTSDAFCEGKTASTSSTFSVYNTSIPCVVISGTPPVPLVVYSKVSASKIPGSIPALTNTTLTSGLKRFGNKRVTHTQPIAASLLAPTSSFSDCPIFLKTVQNHTVSSTNSGYLTSSFLSTSSTSIARFNVGVI